MQNHLPIIFDLVVTAIEGINSSQSLVLLKALHEILHRPSFLCLIFLPTEYDTRDDQWKCRDARSVLQKRKMDSRGPIHFGEELHNIRHQDSSKKLLHKSSAHSSGLLASACL